jgi:hypothetical protein
MKSYRRFGVTDEHYDTVASALLWTLEQVWANSLLPM